MKPLVAVREAEQSRADGEERGESECEADRGRHIQRLCPPTAPVDTASLSLRFG